ncbi:MAG: PhoH family protein, partial [Tissierellia bacterium]|nr:PhoH family protein [Tissierellia bacterium]
MIRIAIVEQNILQLEAGTFQRLCDTYLIQKGYTNICSLGGKAGTNKTTLGTPDTYFFLNGKYIFVEYTTQMSGLFEKIKGDIKKCLDVSKTGVPLDEISEIIYFHTSSKITPREDRMLKKICKKDGITLTLIGINQLASEICNSYPILAREFLGMDIDTNQIMEINDFIKDYNSNSLAAPLDSDCLFREEEIKEIDKAFDENDIVVLSGSAGSGKTRLALYYASNYQKETASKLYCIRN